LCEAFDQIGEPVGVYFKVVHLVEEDIFEVTGALVFLE